MSDFIVKDSGKRQEYDSGMVRDTQEDKPNYNLIDKDFLLRLANHLTKGAIKYGRDTPITQSNWKNVCYCVCNCKRKSEIGRCEINTESQIATQRGYMQVGGCVISAISPNIQSPDQQPVAKEKSTIQEDSVKPVMTKISNLGILNMLNVRLKIMINGFRTIWEELGNTGRTREKNTDPAQKNIYSRGNTNLQPSDSQSRMNPSSLKYKEEDVLSVESSPIGHFSTLTMTTKQEGFEDYYVEDAIRGLDFSEILRNKLKRHSGSCKIHHSIVWENDLPIAKRHSLNNWQLASSSEEMQRFQDSAFRHMMQWMNGETDEDHMAACSFNMMAFEFVKRKIQK